MARPAVRIANSTISSMVERVGLTTGSETRSPTEFQEKEY